MEIGAFEELVKTYEKQVYNVALRYTGSEPDAADVSQEVFLRVWRSLPSFRGQCALSTWIYRIAINVSIDFTRARARRPELSLVVEDADGEATLDVPDDSYAPERAMEQKLLQKSLSDAIRALPEDMRQVVVLRDVNGLSYADISQTLGVNEGTVKSRLARARTKLQKALRASGNITPSVSSKEQGGDAI